MSKNNVFSMTDQSILIPEMTSKVICANNYTFRITVILGKMAQHAPLLALFMAKLKGKSKSVSNMTLGKCIGL